MKKISLAKVLSLVVICVMLLGALALAAFAADEKMKTSLTETETGLLVTFEFDVKNISASSSDKMLQMLDAQSLNAEQLLNQMKEDGFKCGEEEEADSSTTPETDANKNAESK